METQGLKDWQVIRQLRVALRKFDAQQFAALSDADKTSLVELQRAERQLTYNYDFWAFVIEVLKAESRGDTPVKLGKVHKELCRFLRSTKNLKKNALIMVPRYHLKTWIATIYYRIWRCCTDPELCSLIVSGTLELSKATARAIRMELESNAYLRELYPNALPDWIFNDRKNKWSETAFNIARKMNQAQCTVEAVGVEATVTGKHFGEISMDDLVTPENCTTPEQCQKVIQAYRYFCSIVNPKAGRFIVVGTPYTDSDLYTYLKDVQVSRTFRCFIRPVFDSMNEPIWPQMYDKKKLEEIALVQGTYTFSTQYLLDPVPEAQMEFKKEWIRTYVALPHDARGVEIELRRFIIVDPITAKVASSTSKDRGVVLVVGVDRAGNWYVLDYKLYSRAKEADLFAGIFEMCDKWATVEVGWESVAYQLQGKINLEDVARRTGRRIRVRELRPGHTKKEVRIRSLIPFFERGLINIKAWMVELMQELYRFPHGETRDILDCLAYVIQMLDNAVCSWGASKFRTTEPVKRPFYF